MEHELGAIALDWVINIAFGVVALFAALAAAWAGDRLLLRKVDLQEEIRKGNLAAALVFATMLGASAVVIAAAVR